MKPASLVLALIAALLLAGCTGATQSSPEQDMDHGGNDTVSGPTTTAAWMQVTLTDVRTGETFTLDSFDRTVLLESFAVWCPTCTNQQKEIQELHEQVGDQVVSVSLDTDPNEDAAKIQQHLDRHGFDWYYAVAPAEMARSLIDEFGNSVIVPPRAPMILICDDNSFRRLPDGVKTAETLQQEIDQGC